MPPSSAAPGSLLIVGFADRTPPPDLLGRLSRGHLGGVILFSRNFDDPLDLAQAAALVDTLAAHAPLGEPPIVSIDQEGGRVQRLKSPFTVFPPMGRLRGQDTSHCGLAGEVGRAIGEELSALGINVNYAPVLDVHTHPHNPIIGDRALGTTASEVIAQALALLQGMEAASVRGCGKHFPGHGDTEKDSHLTLPVVKADRRRLDAVEIAPFAAACRAGIGMLMTAHVVYPAVDSRPATLSPVWLTEILRRELRFDGVVVSDDLDMQAVATADVGDVIVESLLAGCDAFLLCRDPARQQRAEEALLHAADKSAVVRARIEESAFRLRRFRSTLRFPRPDRTRLSALPDAAHQALVSRICATS